jgi:hypothetical protein
VYLGGFLPCEYKPQLGDGRESKKQQKGSSQG